MGVILGLLLGLGLVLVLQSFSPPAQVKSSSKPPARLRRLLDDAGHTNLSVARVIGSCLALGFVVAVVVLGITATPAIAAVMGVIGGYLPIAVVSSRARRRQLELRAMWPEVVDDLASGVRAGLSLPEAVAALGERGPEHLRPAFKRFAMDHRVSGSFNDCLDQLKDELADPVADRVIEALRLAREVGGDDLGRLLRTLSSFLRQESRTRGELEARQGWTVNAARLAVAAPWVVLMLISLRPEAVAAYRTPVGVGVLVASAGVSGIAYWLMTTIGRLPREGRVLV